MSKNKTFNTQQDEISEIERKKIQKTETIDQKNILRLEMKKIKTFILKNMALFIQQKLD